MSPLTRIRPDHTHALCDVASTRALEVAAAADLAPGSLMQRAGLSLARLVLAHRPHAKCVWLACGPGNNGGDGLQAALELHQRGKEVLVTWAGNTQNTPPNSAQAYARFTAAGLRISQEAPRQATNMDDMVCVDAMLGIGASRGLQGQMAQWALHMQTLQQRGALVVTADVPSGLHADTGRLLDPATPAVCADITLSLLTLKPGLFTGHGRDLCGQVWLDSLGVSTAHQASAVLQGAPRPAARLHASHKGSYGDVAVVGGAPGMRGAALLAASAAMHAGAGRVFVNLLAPSIHEVNMAMPELMFRHWEDLPLARLCVVAGCGAGESLTPYLGDLLRQAKGLVLDADALNSIAAQPKFIRLTSQRDAQTTVMTPHPLEAARLLGSSTQAVQNDRLRAARDVADRYNCMVVLKGSGTVLAAPGHTTTINPTGNALLARGGTGDVLAGMVGAALAGCLASGATSAATLQAIGAAVYRHGELADTWPTTKSWSPSRLAAAAR